MITNAKPMGCGNCGHGLFRMFYRERHPSMDGFRSLLAECDNCRSVSTIGPSEPVIEIGWGKDAEGILAPGKPKSPPSKK